MPRQIIYWKANPRMYAVRQIAAGRIIRERYYHSYLAACRYQDQLRTHGKYALMRIVH